MADNALFKLARQPQVKQRGTILPIAEYDDGSYGMAWPEMLHAPAMAFQRAVDSGMPLSTTDPDAADAAYRDMGEVALGTMFGGSVASMGGVKGAVGMAGGRPPQISKTLAGRDVYDFGGGTTVTMKDWPSGGRMIDNVVTEPASRGNGQARQAIEYIVSEADKAGTPLKLAVSPGDASVDPQRLQSFYEQLGFKYLGGGYMNRDPIGSAGGKLTQGAALPLAAQDATPQGIRAYHGSPHDFDRFSLDYINSGEGAQSYGHGLYFAEAEDVARGYRDQLVDYSNSWRWNAERAPSPDEAAMVDRLKQPNANTGAPMDLEALDLNYYKTILEAERMKTGEFTPPEAIATLDEKIAAAKRAREVIQGMKGNVAFDQPGRMYEVNIKGDPDQFLDWDAPLTKQPDTVQKALAPFLGNDPVKFDIRQGPNGYVVNIVNTHNGSSGLLGPFKSQREAAAAAQNYRPAEWDANTQKAGDYLRQKLTDPNTAAALREAGIPGIRYLDGASRGAGEGSSNYVVFDDQLVDILRKYQNPPTGAALPLAADGGEQQDIEPALMAYLKQIGLY